MPPRYLNVKEAAKIIGISETEVKYMLDRRELHGYRDGADWKFKSEDIERIAKEHKEKAAGGPTAEEGADDGLGLAEGDVLVSEVALGHADPSAFGHGHRHGVVKESIGR